MSIASYKREPVLAYEKISRCSRFHDHKSLYFIVTFYYWSTFFWCWSNYYQKKIKFSSDQLRCSTLLWNTRQYRSDFPNDSWSPIPKALPGGSTVATGGVTHYYEWFFPLHLCSAPRMCLHPLQFLLLFDCPWNLATQRRWKTKLFDFNRTDTFST